MMRDFILPKPDELIFHIQRRRFLPDDALQQCVNNSWSSSRRSNHTVAKACEQIQVSSWGLVEEPAVDFDAVGAESPAKLAQIALSK